MRSDSRDGLPSLSSRLTPIMDGGRARSAFRCRQLARQLQARLPGCLQVQAQYLHFLSLHDALSERQQAVAVQLLTYGTPLVPDRDDERAVVVWRLSVPRLGTISPWSSKATDIFHRCGLGAVERVERGVRWRLTFGRSAPAADALDAALAGLLFDPMTESLLRDEQADTVFSLPPAAALTHIDILAGGIDALRRADARLGLALSAAEQRYLIAQFERLRRNPTDVELMMFAQINSEHCRHKIFNADWRLDGADQSASLFELIKQTHRRQPHGTRVAYSDNAAVLCGAQGERWMAMPDRRYRYRREALPLTIKVETHNHPTAIAPFAGAATGAGGEIRDEAAAGRGGRARAGLVGYSVSHLHHPALPGAWEAAECRPPRIASALQIMLEAPLGAAAFNNEFGRPCIAGYFRSFEYIPTAGAGAAEADYRYGYHKPIMLAGGIGTLREPHIDKLPLPGQTPIIVLGGPAMRIGLGGGSTSSMAGGDSSEELEFASVQRGNPEMQRRCQEVIDACCARGADNPIRSLHDVGAGGLCNALPELVQADGKGGAFELRAISSAEPGMSPMQIWCNESQERYVLALEPGALAEFDALCRRERCPYAVVGRVTEQPELTLVDAHADAPARTPIALPMETLFGAPPRMRRDAVSVARRLPPLRLDAVRVEAALERVLTFPAVADKSFLITIADRSVGGLVCRDQMVGRWQVPVADVGVVADSYTGYTGAAMAIGERTPLAVLDAPASGRIAVAEAITNIAAAPIERLSQVKLSANWMAAAGEPGQDADLYATVRAVTQELCIPIGLSIPVGKDSMSMQSIWRDGDRGTHKAVAPLSLIVSAFAPVSDVRGTLTPQLRADAGASELWLIDLGHGRNRLGGSALAQVYRQLGNQPADLDEAQDLLRLFQLVQAANRQRLLLAYHDRSDGGLAVTLCEMAFSARCGLEIDLPELADTGPGDAGPGGNGADGDDLAWLFNEEPGVVVQLRCTDRQAFQRLLDTYALTAAAQRIGRPLAGDRIVLRRGRSALQLSRTRLHRLWSQTTFQMQRLRDNPETAQQEYDRLLDTADPGLSATLGFDPHDDISAPYRHRGVKPRVAILREQGVNGHLEMAAAFARAGFEPWDVTMHDLSAEANGSRIDLADFKGLAACGGFSFGDVLGAGEGWAKSILFNPQLRDQLQPFFARADTFSLGVCNGCQMLSAIRALIPGAAHWPAFLRNASEQYESRLVMVEVPRNRSILFADMHGSRLPIAVAHTEGRTGYRQPDDLAQLRRQQQVCLRFIDHAGQPAERYPFNPNGSTDGATGFTSDDGRATILMPHPERVFRSVACSWHPDEWGEDSPWMRLFRNARAWVN